MTGRGIEQILPNPGSSLLYETYVHDARDYVALAEKAHGPIPRPVGPEYVWGDVPAELSRSNIDLSIINLETAITAAEQPWAHKEVHYRMHPRNIDVLKAAKIDCCCLSNNHVLDWGHAGLSDTLDALDAGGLRRSGAGRDAAEAAAPAVLDLPGRGRVLVFSYGSVTSGIPWSWSATAERPGLNMLPDLSPETVRSVAATIDQYRIEGDVVIVSVHWGSNWGYHITQEEMRFAHQLVQHGVSVVHGHSSHHVRGLEAYHDGLIIYGCGDFLNDYEGIAGYEEFRGDLTLMYLVTLEGSRVAGVRLVPMTMRQFRLQHASPEDGAWLSDLLNRQGELFGTTVTRNDDLTLNVALKQPAGVG